MRIYISGNIGGEVISEATRRKFAWAEEMLKTKGHEVFNPTCEMWQQIVQAGARIKKKVYGVEPYEYILSKNIEKMTFYDAVYFLEDCWQSPGARAEYFFAKAVGKRMFFQDFHDACDYLLERMYREAKESGKPIEYDGSQERSKIEIAYFTKHLDEAWLPLKGKEGGV